MGKRLQLLLDQERYDLVAGEAQRSGRSVAAVIREAIDTRFDDSDRGRHKALLEFLEMTACPNADEPFMDWPQIKAEMEQDMIEHVDRVLEQ